MLHDANDLLKDRVLSGVAPKACNIWGCQLQVGCCCTAGLQDLMRVLTEYEEGSGPKADLLEVDDDDDGDVSMVRVDCRLCFLSLHMFISSWRFDTNRQNLLTYSYQLVCDALLPNVQRVLKTERKVGLPNRACYASCSRDGASHLSALLRARC